MGEGKEVPRKINSVFNVRTKWIEILHRISRDDMRTLAYQFDFNFFKLRLGALIANVTVSPNYLHIMYILSFTQLRNIVGTYYDTHLMAILM